MPLTLEAGNVNEEHHDGGRQSHLPVAGDRGSDRPWEWSYQSH